MTDLHVPSATVGRIRADTARDVCTWAGIVAAGLAVAAFSAWILDLGPFFRPTGAMAVGVPHYATTPLAPGVVARATGGFAVGDACGVARGTTAVAVGGDRAHGVLVELSDVPHAGVGYCPSTSVFVPVSDADRWHTVEAVKARYAEQASSVGRAASAIEAARR